MAIITKTIVSDNTINDGKMYHLNGNWSDIAIRSFIAKRNISTARVSVAKRQRDADTRSPFGFETRIVNL